jgi:hypothetical protein
VPDERPRGRVDGGGHVGRALVARRGVRVPRHAKRCRATIRGSRRTRASAIRHVCRGRKSRDKKDDVHPSVPLSSAASWSPRRVDGSDGDGRFCDRDGYRGERCRALGATRPLAFGSGTAKRASFAMRRRPRLVAGPVRPRPGLRPAGLRGVANGHDRARP